jgi:hypothetical protein
MRKKVVVFLLILIALMIVGIFIQLKGIREAELNNQIVGMIVGEETSDVKYNMSEIIDIGITEINSDQKYVDFIAQSPYHSVQLKIAGEIFYIAYDSELNQVGRLWEMESADFKVKVSQRELNKMIKMFDEENYRALAMKAVNKVPWRVKISLFKQCKATEWCSAEFFGGQTNSSQ